MNKITIRTKSGSFRRAGRRFTEAPTEIETDDLPKGSLEALRAEPQLIVENSDGEAKKQTAAEKKKAAEEK